MSQIDADRRELTIGELAARSGTSVSALRFYEQRNLISSHRTTGNQRRYRRDVLRRVALIRIAQQAGIPLAEVADVLAELPCGRAPSRRDWQRLSRRWQESLDRRIRLLYQLRDRFTDCVGCGCLSLEPCAVANPCDELGKTGCGPRRLIDGDRSHS